jgi:hypothetical protein
LRIRRQNRISGFALAAGRAQGIAAESPQDLHKQIRGLEAESLVFCPWIPRAKNAPRDMKIKIIAFN